MSKAKLTRDTWVVVTASEKALFLRNLTDHADPNLEIIGSETQDNPSDQAQSANRPGRKQDTGPGQKSAMEDTDWHQLAKERFAADLSDILYKKAHAGEFDRVVLVASPEVLGNLRQDMHKEVLARVVAEVPKTLTNHTVRDIEKLVKQELDVA